MSGNAVDGGSGQPRYGLAIVAVSLLFTNSKEAPVEIRASIGSKGQVTIPRAVREALSISAGEAVLFRVDGRRATIERIPGLMQLAGSVSVPAAKRGTPWDEVLRRTRRTRAAAK